MVNGTIDNPIGETRFTNNGGNVITGASGLVRTNTLRFIVPQSDVGSAGSFFKAELVQSAGRPTHAFATVGSDVFLELTAKLRDPVVTSALVGASSVAQLEQNVAALDRLEFSPAELKEIDRHATDGGINIWAASSES